MLLRYPTSVATRAWCELLVGRPSPSARRIKNFC